MSNNTEDLKGLQRLVAGLQSITHGDIFEGKDGRIYYSFTEFSYGGYTYRIDFADKPRLKKFIFGTWTNVPVVVKDKNCRPMYIFPKAGLWVESHTFMASRELVNCVLLLRGGLDAYRAGKNNVNHMCCAAQSLAEYDELWALGIKQWKLSRVKDITKLSAAELDFLALCKSSVEAPYSTLREMTNNFEYKPARLRDDSIYNLELCTAEENSKHYSSVLNLTKAATDGENYFNKRLSVSDLN